MYKRNEFYNQLLKRFERIGNQSIITDVYDLYIGSEWIIDFSQIPIIFLLADTDRVPVFKSSKISMISIFNYKRITF